MRYAEVSGLRQLEVWSVLHLRRAPESDSSREISDTAKLTSPVYLLTDIASAIVNAPKSWLVTSEHSLDTVFGRTKKDAYLKDFSTGAHKVYFTGDSYSGGFNRLGRRATWIATGPVKVVTTPFTYTLAKPAWDVMLRRTNTPFFTPEDLAIPIDPVTKQKIHRVDIYGKRGRGALNRFLDVLQRKFGKRLRLTLIGHSMGAIIVNRMVGLSDDVPRCFDADDSNCSHDHLPIDKIVHMASADSINSLFEKVLPYLKNHPQTKFYSLSLHPENEDRERNQVGMVPSGSLLVWIDNMYTTPETVLDKRSGRWENMERALPFIHHDLRSRMYFKIFGLDKNGNSENGGADENGKPKREWLTSPQKHGDFDELRFWLEDTWWGAPTGS